MKARECYDPLCCPVGMKEHIQCYRHQRDNNPPEYVSSFREYWWHEFKSLIGLNRMSKEDRKEMERWEAEEAAEERSQHE